MVKPRSSEMQKSHLQDASPSRLCAILLNYENWADTLECLESLARAKSQDMSVVVVDTGSPNNSVEKMVRWVEEGWDARGAADVWRRLPESRRVHPTACTVVPAASRSPSPVALPLLSEGITFLKSKDRLGFSAGCNRGIRYALADPAVDLLWLLNNDTVVAPDAPGLLASRAGVSDRSLGACGAVVAEYKKPDTIQLFGGGCLHGPAGEPRLAGHGQPLTSSGALRPELDFLSGASLLTRRTVVERIGLLDERLHLYWEDADWCARMKAEGLELEVASQAVVWHKGQASTGGVNAYTKYHSARSGVIYMRTHRKAWPLPVLNRLAKSVPRDLLRGQPRHALAVVRGVVSGLRASRTPSPARSRRFER